LSSSINRFLENWKFMTNRLKLQVTTLLLISCLMSGISHAQKCQGKELDGTIERVEKEDNKTDKNDSENTLETENHTNNGYIDSYQAMELGQVTAVTIMMQGQRALSAGNTSLAITKFRRAIDMDNEDMDAHRYYAEALEKKLRSQVDKDPELFNECVRQWLTVMRNIVGDEKGMSIRGVNPIADLYGDEDHAIMAKNHLVKLTGSAPKFWETNAHYLKKVLKPSTENVAGTVVKK